MSKEYSKVGSKKFFSEFPESLITMMFNVVEVPLLVGSVENFTLESKRIDY